MKPKKDKSVLIYSISTVVVFVASLVNGLVSKQANQALLDEAVNERFDQYLKEQNNQD